MAAKCERREACGHSERRIGGRQDQRSPLSSTNPLERGIGHDIDDEANRACAKAAIARSSGEIPRFFDLRAILKSLARQSLINRM
jgi:hypothetical protein